MMYKRSDVRGERSEVRWNVWLMQATSLDHLVSGDAVDSAVGGGDGHQTHGGIVALEHAIGSPKHTHTHTTP